MFIRSKRAKRAVSLRLTASGRIRSCAVEPVPMQAQEDLLSHVLSVRANYREMRVCGAQTCASRLRTTWSNESLMFPWEDDHERQKSYHPLYRIGNVLGGSGVD
jgi:hypothetical protein